MFVRFLLAGFLVAGLASVASAQRGGGGPSGDGGDAQFCQLAGRPFMGETRLDRFTLELKLTKEQKNDAKEIFDAAQKEAAAVRDKLQMNRGALLATYIGKQSQPQIDQILATQGTLEAQMIAIEGGSFAKFLDTLTADQQKKAPQIFQQIAGMYNGRNWNVPVN